MYKWNPETGNRNPETVIGKQVFISRVPSPETEKIFLCI